MDINSTFNILLLGETGVGKTTFVNSCANYIRHGSFEEAFEDPLILIDVSFSITSPGKYETRKVILSASSPDDSRNEQRHTVGESTTQDPVIHTIDVAQDGARKRIQFIDTPGVNDTRGWEQDERNFEKILEVIRSVGELHAICILLKPNESTLTLGFRNALDHLLVKLHASSTKNIVFCFTNTRSTLYRPGETLPVLEKYLEGIKGFSDVRIIPDTFNVFCFDNDCFRYLCTLLSNEEKNERLHGMLKSGWEKNVTELKRLLNRVQCLVPHLVQDTLAINTVQNTFKQNAKTLAEQAVTFLIEKKTIDAKVDQLNIFCAQKLKNIETTTTLYTIQEVRCSRLVCHSETCTSFVQLKDGRRVRMPKICHDNCQVRKEPSCSDIFYNAVFGPTEPDMKHLQQCVVFTPNQNIETAKHFNRNVISNCQGCGCSWKKHKQVRTEFVPGRTETYVSSEDAHQTKKELQESKAMIKRLQIELIKVQDRIQAIETAVTELSAYLSVHSVKKGTDPFLYHLDRLFDIEKNKETDENPKLDVIRAVRERYLERASSIAYSIERRERATMTAEQLLRMVKDISNFK